MQLIEIKSTWACTLGGIGGMESDLKSTLLYKIWLEGGTEGIDAGVVGCPSMKPVYCGRLFCLVSSAN